MQLRLITEPELAVRIKETTTAIAVSLTGLVVMLMGHIGCWIALLTAHLQSNTRPGIIILLVASAATAAVMLAILVHSIVNYATYTLVLPNLLRQTTPQPGTQPAVSTVVIYDKQ